MLCFASIAYLYGSRTFQAGSSDLRLRYHQLRQVTIRGHLWAHVSIIMVGSGAMSTAIERLIVR